MKKSIGIAALIALAVAGWIFSANWSDAEDAAMVAPAPTNAAAEAAKTEKLDVLVEINTFVAEPRMRRIELRGRTEASRWVDIRAETSARVTAINAQKGARVRDGDVIAELALEDREAKLAEAIALVRQRQVEHEASQRLSERGYRAQNKLAESAALLDKALAAQAQIELDIENTKIRAPFDGVLELRHIEIGDYVSRNMVVARVVDQDPYLVVGQISEIDIPFMKVGDTGVATLASGEQVEGRVRFIATTADPKTRTFRVEMEVRNRDRTLRDGLTAEIKIEVDQSMAHHVSSAILTLNDEGQLGVRGVDANNRVVFYPVKITDDTGDGVWVSGLPERVDVITVGQEFVRAGDTVRTKRAVDGANS
ncbi:MAG: efflux RND transporter periplasmic adaptor subunit [Alphaproteobacteria bacterium]